MFTGAIEENIYKPALMVFTTSFAKNIRWARVAIHLDGYLFLYSLVWP